VRRRAFLATAGALALVPQAGRAQTVNLDPIIETVTKGAPARKARVSLDLPVLADNGNSLPMKVRVDSPMTGTDHVKAIYLLSERNPVRNMATFHLGPRAGRAAIESRIRLAGSQHIVALAEMSDGTFWYDWAAVVVTLSACIDES
jgi:sulfur-oxidizing protein SoxY